MDRLNELTNTSMYRTLFVQNSSDVWLTHSHIRRILDDVHIFTDLRLHTTYSRHNDHNDYELSLSSDFEGDHLVDDYSEKMACTTDYYDSRQ